MYDIIEGLKVYRDAALIMLAWYIVLTTLAKLAGLA